MAPIYERYVLYDKNGKIVIITTNKTIYNNYKNRVFMGGVIGSTDTKKLVRE